VIGMQRISDAIRLQHWQREKLVRRCRRESGVLFDGERSEAMPAPIVTAILSKCGPLVCRRPRLLSPMSFAIYSVYRPPAVRFNGMSDGIGAVRRVERQTEQTVEWLGDD
jgi:hypothetical protein